MTLSITRTERTAKPQVVPEPIRGKPGLVQADATWGTIQPMQLVAGVCVPLA